MELELISFISGAVIGGGFLGFGIVIGVLLDSGTLRRKPKEAEYDPDEMPMNDEFFERARLDPDDGGLEFPTDQQLEELHRHSNYEVTDAE